MYKLCNYFRYIETYLLLCGAADPRLTGPNPSFTSPTPFLRSMAATDRGIRTPTSVSNLSTQPACVQPLDQPEEHPLPRVPRQEAVNQLAAGPDELARHPQERLAVGRELHPQQRAPLRLVLGTVPRRHRDQQRAPGLEAPGQRAHHHVRPVADQVIHGSR